MKRIYLLVFCLGTALLGKAQQQYEFGFVVKAGNYGFPSSKTTTSDLGDANNEFKVQFKSGQQYSLGLWQSIPLGRHFALSGELLYQRSFYNRAEIGLFRYIFNNSVFISHSRGDFKIQESSISLPIKLLYSFKRKNKFSMAIGTGLTHPVSSSLAAKHSTWNESSNLASEPSWNSYQKFKIRNYTYNIQFTSGIYYRIEDKTILGLEYIFEKTFDPIQYYNDSLSLCNCLCDCFSYSSPLRPNLNSFSVSLRHNILD